MKQLIPSLGIRAFVLLLTIPFFQCSKEDPDNSAIINASVSLFSNAAMQGRITINAATMNLAEVNFTGTQPSLSVVSFTQGLAGDASVISLMEKDKPQVKIVAHRNDYDPLTLTLTLNADTHELAIQETDAGPMADLTSYLSQASPALMITGRFDNRGRSIPIYIAFPRVNPLRDVADQYGSAKVTLDMENLAEIQLNPSFLFDAITTAQLDGATRTLHAEQDVIFIHPAINSALYDAMLARLEDGGNALSTRVRVTRSGKDQ